MFLIVLSAYLNMAMQASSSALLKPIVSILDFNTVEEEIFIVRIIALKYQQGAINEIYESTVINGIV